MTIWGSAYESLSLEEKCAELNRLIAEWREPGFVSVRPARVVPDTTNREGTGISAMHVHFVAHSIQCEGFETRDDVTGAGHDVPFLVREVTGAASELGGESLLRLFDHAHRPSVWRRYTWLGRAREAVQDASSEDKVAAARIHLQWYRGASLWQARAIRRKTNPAISRGRS